MIGGHFHYKQSSLIRDWGSVHTYLKQNNKIAFKFSSFIQVSASKIVLDEKWDSCKTIGVLLNASQVENMCRWKFCSLNHRHSRMERLGHQIKSRR